MVAAIIRSTEDRKINSGRLGTSRTTGQPDIGPLDLGQWTLRLLYQMGKCTDTSEALKTVERPLGALDMGPFRITNINILCRLLDKLHSFYEH